MQINRLFEIVYILLEKKTITAKELAQKFEVSTRTIYRDIDILSQSNIPIYTNKGKGGGISLLEDYVFNKSLLSEEEQTQILFALQGVNKISNENEENILNKMSTLFQKSQTNWIEIDFSNWGTIGEKDNTFSTLKQAILKQKVIEFTYYNTAGKESKRKVEPLQIYFKDKAWYLKAYCTEKQDYRLFKIARMRKIQIREETFERELPKQIEKSIEVKTITLILEISKKQAYRVYDEFQKENIKKQENGDFLITVTYPENDWIYGYILSFGEDIKVKAPDRVKKEIVQRLEKSINNYKI